VKHGFNEPVELVPRTLETRVHRIVRFAKQVQHFLID
jgi:hypothetical protein